MQAAVELLDEELIAREWAERKLVKFLEQAWTILEPETPFLPNWHLDCIADYLEGVAAGHITRLIINMPPRALKSTIVTVMWPVWMWGPGKRPSSKWMMTSYDAKLSTQHSIFRRTIIESEWYQERWGMEVRRPEEGYGVEIADDRNVKNHFANDRRGEMFSTSMTGAGSGFGCDFLVFDDPHNPRKAESEAERNSAKEAFRLQFSRRLNNKKTGAIVGVAQRLHEDDLPGLCLELGYTHLCLEGISPKKRYILLPSTLPPGCPIHCDCGICTDKRILEAKKAGLPPPPEEASAPPSEGRYYEREKGEYLHEEREGAAEHATARKELGSAGYSGQYDQRPNPKEGLKFKRQWFRYFRDAGDHFELLKPNPAGGQQIERVMKSLCTFFGTVDTAMTEETVNDPTGMGLWALTPKKDLLLFDVVCEHMEDPDVERLLRGVLESRRVHYLAIEKKVNGLTLFQRFVREGYHIKALKAEGDKLTRSTAAAIDMENGKIFFLADAPWLGGYELELLQFPNGSHDDQVDVTSYASIEKGKDFDISIPSGPIGSYPSSSQG